MRRHALCPTCTCQDTLAAWADQHLIPTPDTQTPMWEITQALLTDHPELGLTQKAVTGRLRSMHGVGGRPYLIKNNRAVAVLTGYALRRDTDLNLSNSADTAA